jgi:hypothetical protein
MKIPQSQRKPLYLIFHVHIKFSLFFVAAKKKKKKVNLSVAKPLCHLY